MISHGIVGKHPTNSFAPISMLHNGRKDIKVVISHAKLSQSMEDIKGGLMTNLP